MTIRTEKQYIVSSFEEFLDILDVDWAEIFGYLPDEVFENAIEYENSQRNRDDSKLESIADFEADETAQKNFVDAVGTAEIITLVLEHRDAEYIYLSDDISSLQILRLVPDNEAESAKNDESSIQRQIARQLAENDIDKDAHANQA